MTQVTLLMIILGSTIPPTYTTTRQLNVAASMGAIANVLRAKFVVALGDNFHTQGVTSISDFRFNKTWEEVYTHPALQVPWYHVVGEHDYYGNVQAQQLYTQVSASNLSGTPKKRWILPSLNHDHVERLPNSFDSVHLIFFDTFHLTSEAHATFPVDDAWAQTSVNWLSSVLSNSTSNWKFIFTHYPYISAGRHGYNAEIAQKLKPLMSRHKPAFLMASHDHNLQHLTDSDDAGFLMNHYVVGSSALLSTEFNYTQLPTTSTLLTRIPLDGGPLEGGFASVVVCPSNATVRFYNEDGIQRYVYRHLTTPTTTMPPVVRSSPPPPPPITAATPATNNPVTLPPLTSLPPALPLSPPSPLTPAPIYGSPFVDPPDNAVNPGSSVNSNTPSTKKSSFGTIGWIIVGVIAALVLIALVIFIVLCRRRVNAVEKAKKDDAFRLLEEPGDVANPPIMQYGDLDKEIL